MRELSGTPGRLPRLVVVHDQGAARPLQLIESLAGLAEVVFVACRPEPDDPMLPVLRDLADTVVLDDDPAAAVAALRARDPQGIVTFSERRLAETAALAQSLGLEYHTPEAVEVLTDKYRQRGRLREHGVDSVRSTLLTSADQWSRAVAEVGLPAVVKPATGQGSRSTFRIDSAEQGGALVAWLLASLDAGGEGESALVLEQFLAGADRGRFGDYVSVESAVRGGEVFHWAVTGRFPLRPPFREAGLIWPADLAPDESAAVRDLATRAIRALGLRIGITHTEIKLTAEGPRIIEVNGRLGGFLSGLARQAGGLDPVRLAARIALGERVPPAAVPTGHTAFAHLIPAPIEPCRILRVHGVGETLAIPAINAYEPASALRTWLPGGVHTAGIAVLWGRAADHAEMFAAVDRALDALSVTAELAGGMRELTARELGAAVPQPA